MSKEAMKLALEALKRMQRYGNTFGYRSHEQNPYEQVCEAITFLETELAKPDFWEEYIPEPDSTCSNALRIQHKPYPRTCKKCGLGPCVELAQQALEKKAENARELGLMPYDGGDYEPEQEPVAWEGGEGWESLAWELCADENGEDSCNELIWEGGPIPEPWGDRWMKYEEEAKRLIALVQKHTTPPQRTWVDLTDKEILASPENLIACIAYVRNKLKEKNGL